MSQESVLNYQRLSPQQAPLLCDGIRRVYGGTYPMAEFYSPDYITRMIAGKKLYTVIALNAEGHVVAQMSTVLEQPGDVTADGSALMVDSTYRGLGATQNLGEAMLEVYREQAICGLHLYALALHDRVQNKSGGAGATVTGILPAWFSDAVRVDGYDYPEGFRIGAVCLYMPLAELPHRQCYLPSRYQAALEDIYGRLGADRTLLRAPQHIPPCAKSTVHVDDTPANGHCRLRVDTIGADFAAELSDLCETTLNSREVAYLDLPLSDPSMEHAVNGSRQQGFFFGALMADRCGSDRLRLQRYRAELASPKAMVVASDEGNVLRTLVLQDRPNIKSG